MPKFNYKKEAFFSIIKNAQEGDVKALEELIRRVQKQVYVFFLHMTYKKEDVSDLTQEALLKMAKSINQLKNIKAFKSWLNQIVTNVYYDYVKKNNDINIEYDNEKLKEFKDKIGCEPGEKCIFSEMEKIIRLALMTLPKDLRITLVLREYEGLSYQDIAKITNTALGTVKSRISRARLQLQRELKEFL